MKQVRTMIRRRRELLRAGAYGSLAATAVSALATEGGGKRKTAQASATSGPSWKPERDASGAVRSTSLAQLALNTWTHVSGSEARLESVFQTPRYPRFRGGDGSAGIVQAWGGAAWDPIQQRMYITGGGHGDTSAADTGIYQLEASTLKFTRIVDRQPLSSTLKPSGGPSLPCSKLVLGEPWEGGNNYPLSTGVPGTNHTYDGLPWIEPGTMRRLGFLNNTKGGMFYPGRARAVVDLDSGQYSKLHFKCAGVQDGGYYIAFVDGNIVYFTSTSGGGFAWFRWDMSQSEMTNWQTSGYDPTPAVPSFGKDLSNISHRATFLYNRKAICWMRERREIVSFFGDQNATRIRYGQAIDAGATDWTAYCDTIRLTGAGAADFTAANFEDTGENLLSQTSGSYDLRDNTAGGAIWLQANTLGGQLYKITSLTTNAWTVAKITGNGAIASAGAGTYGRFAVAVIGGTKVAIRVTSTTGQIQIIRLSRSA